MRLLSVCLAFFVSGCANTQPAAPVRNTERWTEEAERDEVVRHCDNEQLADVYSSALLLGPTCEKAPSALAANLFQTGAMLGGFAGESLVRTQATLDAVREFPVDHETGAGMVDLSHQAAVRADDNEKSSIRKAVAGLVDHECVVAAAALRILRDGASCGETAFDTARFKSAYRDTYTRICSNYSPETDCVSRADAGFRNYVRDYRESIARELQKLRE